MSLARSLNRTVTNENAIADVAKVKTTAVGVFFFR